MKLSIIILNYNTRELVDQAIRSIKADVSHQIIVVDNASTDNTVTFLKSHHPHVKLIENKKNLGFAAGNNLGLKIASGDYLLLLNSDTRVKKGSLDSLVAFADSHPHVGIITPKLILEDGAIDLSCHRGFPTLGNSLAYFLGLESLFPGTKFFSGYHQTYQDFETPHPIDVVSGAAMLIKKQVIADIGYLDEQFFMYAEDIDFCLRAHQAGWQTFYLPGATVVHFKGASGTHSARSDIKSKTRQYFYTTMAQYFNKHHAKHYPQPVNHIIKTGISWLAKLRN